MCGEQAGPLSAPVSKLSQTSDCTRRLESARAHVPVGGQQERMNTAPDSALSPSRRRRFSLRRPSVGPTASANGVRASPAEVGDVALQIAKRPGGGRVKGERLGREQRRQPVARAADAFALHVRPLKCLLSDTPQ